MTGLAVSREFLYAAVLVMVSAEEEFVGAVVSVVSENAER